MKVKVLKIFLVSVFLLAIAGQTQGAVINAASGVFAVVSNAVASASPGDTVLIPAGTNIWTRTLNFGGVTLQGSGVGKTIIVDETPATGNGTPLFQLNLSKTSLTRLSGIQFALGVTNTHPYRNYNGEIIIYGQSPLWRVDNCQFTYLTGKPIHVGDGSYGLIDHDTFLMNQMANCLEIDDTGYGDISWAAPSSFGTSNAVFMEDCYVYAADNFCAADIDSGGRIVFRHNTMVGCFFNTHGTETGQRFRSSRQVEVYNNSFTWGGGLQYNNFYTACDLRGGAALVFSNTFLGYYSVANINIYRATDNDVNFAPFFGATGLRGWDSNGPALLSGTASVTSSNVLVVSGSTWTTNQWVGCTVYNSNNTLLGMVSGNTTDTMTFKTSRSSWLQIKFTQGDGFVVHNITAMIDQPGRGQSDLLSGDSPTPVWLHHVSEPIYFWSNSLSLVYQAPTKISSKVSSPFTQVQENRDFFNDTPKPGYTPFTYPHPLTLITNAVTVTNPIVTLPTNTPPPVNTLPPPTGLNVRPL
ncbi:MAG TPA: hypothetical protein VG347_11695 [Verrucomicrobiae bacterium]|nr:hypothetical protein [Verrucomicrobiae bacterium]